MIEARGEYRWSVTVADSSGQPYEVEIVLVSDRLIDVARATIANKSKRSRRGGFRAHARISAPTGEEPTPKPRGEDDGKADQLF